MLQKRSSVPWSSWLLAILQAVLREINMLISVIKFSHEIPLNSFADFSAEYTLLYFLPCAALRREMRYIIGRFCTKNELHCA